MSTAGLMTNLVLMYRVGCPSSYGCSPDHSVDFVSDGKKETSLVKSTEGYQSILDELFPETNGEEQQRLLFLLEHCLILLQVCFIVFTSKDKDKVIEDKYRQEYF